MPERKNRMEQKADLQQIRKDFLSFSELDGLQVDVYTRKNLMKGMLNNFFDYLENLEEGILYKSDEERVEVKF